METALFPACNGKYRSLFRKKPPEMYSIIEFVYLHVGSSVRLHYFEPGQVHWLPILHHEENYSLLSFDRQQVPVHHINFVRNFHPLETFDCRALDFEFFSKAIRILLT